MVNMGAVFEVVYPLQVPLRRIIVLTELKFLNMNDFILETQEPVRF